MSDNSIRIKTEKNALEIIDYSFPDIRIALQDRILSNYAGMRAVCHWHSDFEFIYIFDGEMNYDINGEIVLLKKGDLLFVNSERLHYGFSNDWKDCKFFVLIFNTNLLKSNLNIFNKQVKPIIESSLNYKIFNENNIIRRIENPGKGGNVSFPKTIKTLINDLKFFSEHKEQINKYDILASCFSVWSLVSDNITISDISEISYGLEDLDLQKHMVNFIYQNFQQQITLDEIAASANVSRSKCCRLFQKYLNESPILFLKDYRLRKSCDLLLQSNYSITEIATMVGYNHLSYYSKIFLEKYGMTPHDYRKEKNDN